MAESEVDYDWPSEGELVIGKVKTVKDFGAFLELEEYGDKEGFIHISEISSGWVKRIRDHIREGQKRVCKVLRIDKNKGHIDLSLKQVNEHQKREKIQAWKNQQKAEKLLTMVGEKLGLTLEECYDEFAVDLIEEFDSLYKAFEEVTIDKDILKKKGFEGDWVDEFVNTAEENISPPYVSITGYVDISSTERNGLEDIKYALNAFEDTETSKVEVNYVAAPKYSVDIRSSEYKDAESVFKEQAKEAVERILERGGEGRYYREDE